MTKVSVWSPTTSNTMSYVVSNLNISSAYYVKAYATNTKGEGVGDVVAFSTADPEISVSSSKKVIFSLGNLQYNNSSQKYLFASSQYTYLGTDNVTENSSGWTVAANLVDVFTLSDMQNSYRINDENWRCLSNAEWQYIFSTRTDAINKRTLATVCDIAGLIILPDKWELPSSISAIVIEGKKFDKNVYTQSQWQVLENAGAVFLPAAGYTVSMSTRGFYGVGNTGTYWTTTSYNSQKQYCVWFPSAVAGETNIKTSLISISKSDALPIRVVKDFN